MPNFDASPWDTLPSLRSGCRVGWGEGGGTTRMEGKDNCSLYVKWKKLLHKNEKERKLEGTIFSTTTKVLNTPKLLFL